MIQHSVFLLIKTKIGFVNQKISFTFAFAFKKAGLNYKDIDNNYYAYYKSISKKRKKEDRF